MQTARTFTLLLSFLLTAALAQGGHVGHETASSGNSENQDMQHGMGHDALEELEGEAFEVGFLSMMIEHHRGALEESEWILERTERDELREAAERIIASQEAEIETMLVWLREWYGQDPDPAMVAMMAEENEMMMETMMNTDEPEHAFLEMMIMHHQGAIDMAQLALTQAVNEPLREMARDIILEQAEEIYVFEGWRRDW